MLAIVIPYYKIIFFEKTLESLAQQIDQRFHVYIGDDASPNAPKEILEKYQGKFNFTYKRFNDNLGNISLVKQWERCMDMMQDEEWLMILGDDDVLGQNVVEAFYKNFPEIEKTSHVVRFSSVLINKKDGEIMQRAEHPKFENAIDSYLRKIRGENRATLSEFIFNTKKYQKYKFKNYYAAWSSDDRAIIDFSENKDIFTINEAIVFVRLTSLNISGNNSDILNKKIAHLNNSRELLFDYFFKLTKNQKLKLINYYYYQIFSIPKVGFLDIFFIIFLFTFYKQNKEVLNLLKSILNKLLYGNR